MLTRRGASRAVQLISGHWPPQQAGRSGPRAICEGCRIPDAVWGSPSMALSRLWGKERAAGACRRAPRQLSGVSAAAQRIDCHRLVGRSIR